MITSACAGTAQRSAQPPSAPAAVGSTAGTTPADSSCALTGDPLARLPQGAPGEPILSIPQPAGWELTTTQNTALIRGAIRAPGLQSGDFVPNAVVTLADVTADSDTPESAIYTEKTAISQKTPIDNVTSGTVCTFPSETFDYTIDGRPTTSLIVGARDPNGKVWLATVVIASTDPTNPDFAKAKHSILGGFQLRTTEAGTEGTAQSPPR